MFVEYTPFLLYCLTEAADELTVFDIQHRVACVIVRITRARVYHTDVTAVRSVNGNVLRAVCMTEEEDVRVLLYGVVCRELMLSLHEQSMTVCQKEADTADRHETFADERSALTVRKEELVAVSADVVEGNIGEPLHDRDRIVNAVAEEEYAVNAAVGQVGTYSLGHTKRISVDIGKDQ